MVRPVTDIIDQNNPIPAAPPGAGVPRDPLDYALDFAVVLGAAALVTVGLVFVIGFCVSRLALNRSMRWQTRFTALAAPTLIVMAGVLASIIGHDGRLDGLGQMAGSPWLMLAIILFIYVTAWVSARFYFQRMKRNRRVATGEVFR